MIDWPGIFAREVAPTLARFSAPVPTPILVLAAIFVLGGVALLLLLPFPRSLAGWLPIALVVFGAVMVQQGRAAVRQGDTRVREGRLLSKRVETVLRDSAHHGGSEASHAYVLEVELRRSGVLTAAGVELREVAATRSRLTTSETLYAALPEGASFLGISLPTGPDFVHWLVLPDGRVVR